MDFGLYSSASDSTPNKQDLITLNTSIREPASSTYIETIQVALDIPGMINNIDHADFTYYDTGAAPFRQGIEVPGRGSRWFIGGGFFSSNGNVPNVDVDDYFKLHFTPAA